MFIPGKRKFDRKIRKSIRIVKHAFQNVNNVLENKKSLLKTQLNCYVISM